MELIDLLYRSDYKSLSSKEAGKVVGGTYVFDKLKLPTLHQVYTVIESKQKLVVVRLKRDGAIVFSELLEPGKMKAAGNIDTPFRINQIGLPPEPSANAVIPPDGPAIVMGATLKELEHYKVNATGPIASPLVAVMAATKPTHVATWHTQRWRKSANSYTLAPGQKKNVLIEQKSGITRVDTATTTSTESASASAGGALDSFSGLYLGRDVLFGDEFAFAHAAGVFHKHDRGQRREPGSEKIAHDHSLGIGRYLYQRGRESERGEQFRGNENDFPDRTRSDSNPRAHLQIVSR
jgi:hypothetical protein